MIKKILFAVIVLTNISIHAQVKSFDEEINKDQEYKIKTHKIKFEKGTLNLNVNNAIIEGYNGNEVIIEKNELVSEIDERSFGLQSISSAGLMDNTGVGINVKVEGDRLEATNLDNFSSALLKIKVPKNVKIIFKSDSEFTNEIQIKNITNEIEIDLRFSNLILDNVTGPVTAKILHGNIEAKFNETIKGPISLVSIYGFIDLTLPSKTNADLKLSTKFGDILKDPLLKLNLNAADGNKMFKNTMLGKLNSGGNDIQLKSDFGKIYIRSLK